MIKQFTGDKKVWIELTNYLIKEGFKISGTDSIHIGDNKYEFEETFSGAGLGCHDIHKILIWKENNEIKYKKKIVGFCCMD